MPDIMVPRHKRSRDDAMDCAVGRRGGSYRTTQCFFTTRLHWGMVQWVLSRHYLCAQDDVVLMGGDDVW